MVGGPLPSADAEDIGERAAGPDAMCESDVMPSGTTLPWPDAAGVLPVEPPRPVLERLASLALRHPEDVSLLPTRVDDDGEVDESTDPPPSLEQVVEEFGGITVRGRAGLTLLVDERTDLGPYTPLGAPTTYYPLHEGEDVAVVLTIGEDGAPGAVYGIGEDLAPTLAARDLGAFLERYAEALTATLDALDAEIARTRGADAVADDHARADVAAELMDAHLFRTILGALPEAERITVPVHAVGAADIAEEHLPEGTLAVADLRDAPLDASVAVMDADLPGDPVYFHLAWDHAGQVIAVVAEED